MPTEEPTFARFFRAVEGKLAPRYGTASATSPNLWLGATRDAKSGQIVWDTKTVHAIPHKEAARFKREYDRLVRDGALKECTPADWEAFRKEASEAKKKATKDAESAAAEAAKKTEQDASVANDKKVPR